MLEAKACREPTHSGEYSAFPEPANTSAQQARSIMPLCRLLAVNCDSGFARDTIEERTSGLACAPETPHRLFLLGSLFVSFGISAPT